MRRDRPSMKSILEEARAMRTASLSGKKKVGINSNSSGSKGSDFGSISQIQSVQSQSQPMGNSNYIPHLRHSFEIHQRDSSNSQSRFQPEPMTRKYFDNDSPHILNMSQQDHYSPHFIMNHQSQQFRRPSFEELSLEAFAKINQLICMDYKPSNKMAQIKEKLESSPILQNNNGKKLKQLLAELRV